MRQARAATRDPRERYVPILDGLCERGRFGRKAGRGYYAYPEGRQVRTTDDEVRALIVQASTARGLQRRALPAQEIVRRALLAMVNEAALLWAEGVAQRASDIDVVLVQGYGFPRWQGGPVFWARQQTRTSLQAGLQQLGEAAGFGFVVAELDGFLQA
jgi:3-hydroxyacyl-CoA dehydrogenase